MASFVRGSLVTCAVTFTPANGNGAQPTEAFVVIQYLGSGTGVDTETTIPLTRDLTTDIWSATWDTTLSNGGQVDWWAYSTGAVQAAAQGSFNIKTNRASDP